MGYLRDRIFFNFRLSCHVYSSLIATMDLLQGLKEQQLTTFLLAFYFLCISGIPAYLLYEKIDIYTMVVDLSFCILVVGAAFGWMCVVKSSKFLGRADRAHRLLVRKSKTYLSYYIRMCHSIDGFYFNLDTCL